MSLDQLRIEDAHGGALLWIKAVPGGSRDAIAGVIGDRLKIKVCAPAEGGKANKAICQLLATTIGVQRQDVSISTGATNPAKIVRIDDVAPGELRRRLSDL